MQKVAKKNTHPRFLVEEAPRQASPHLVMGRCLLDVVKFCAVVCVIHSKQLNINLLSNRHSDSAVTLDGLVS